VAVNRAESWAPRAEFRILQYQAKARASTHPIISMRGAVEKAASNAAAGPPRHDRRDTHPEPPPPPVTPPWTRNPSLPTKI